MKSDKKHNVIPIKSEAEAGFVDCENCGLFPVCRPIESGGQSMVLVESFLSRREAVKLGESLFLKDDPLTDIYAVSSGTFKIVQYGVDGEEQILGFRFPGELLGEDALYPGKYGYTAVAISGSSVCRLPVQEFNASSNIIPTMQRNMIELLSMQCYVTQKQMSSLAACKSAEQKLVAFLLNIAERKAAHDGSSTNIKLTITRDNIANFLGLRRETLSRLLSRLQKEGLLAIKGKQLQLLQPDRLNKLANL